MSKQPTSVDATNKIVFRCDSNEAKMSAQYMAKNVIGAEFLCESEEKTRYYYWSKATGTLIEIICPPPS